MPRKRLKPKAIVTGTSVERWKTTRDFRRVVVLSARMSAQIVKTRTTTQAIATASAAAAAASHAASTDGVDNSCEVCLVVPSTGVAPGPCARLCAACADAIAAMGNGCPLCRPRIDMVTTVFS